MLKKRKGMIYPILMGIISLFILAIIYYYSSIVYLDYIAPEMNMTGLNTDAQETKNWIQLVWRIWPIILALAIAALIYASSQRREWDTGIIE